MAEGGYDLEAVFLKASEYAKANMGALKTDQILNLYGLFKQATLGKNVNPKPHFWNVTDRQKWEAWTANGDKPQKKAKEEYIGIVNSINPNWLEEPLKNSSWVVHSTLKNENADVPESEQDIFYWVKENDKILLEKVIHNADLTITDKEGLSLLHWAADRGHTGVIRLLMDSGADPDARDQEGQTPLHYAASCGHVDAVNALLAGGASILISDEEGNSPKDVAATSEIAQIINSKIC